MTEKREKNIDQVRPSTYDGIQEYDNDLPRWWLWLFYLTGVYAAVYIVAWWGFGVTLPPVPHEPSGVIARTTVTTTQVAQEVDESSVLASLVKDPASIAKGRDVFATKCAPCHGVAGGGIIGPNLTDDSWLHGGSLVEIKRVIEQGVPEKGMLAWKSMMGQEDIRAVVAYIRSLRGSHPPGAKSAEGAVYAGGDL